ncbi:MAG: DEAD/DEAH box helicase [Aestuariivita sp.]|nr:DEAD/DEAH box helicase [Aestuariivita sp.]
MDDSISKLPVRFSDIQVAGKGLQKSASILEPVCLISRENGKFIASLAGRRMTRGKAELFETPTIQHNWVEDNRVIRPLPHDAPKLFSEILSEMEPKNVSFHDVVRLTTLCEPPLRIEIGETVFTVAKLEASENEDEHFVDGLKAKLYPYQAGGVRWMHDTIQHTGGLILADEMGLGKTIQIISLLLRGMPSPEAPALIICPTSLIENWCQEIFRFGPTLSVSVHRGARRTGIARGLQSTQVVITTYDTLVNDQAIFASISWSWLICDEAQAVKNPDSLRRQAIATIPRQRTIPMTGTPVETSLLNLWSLVDLAIPDLLGERGDFESAYPDTEASASQLAKLTNPIVLRRLVVDVAGDLPERIDIDVPLTLSHELAIRYSQVLDETLERYPTAGALVATGQLQIFCAHPWLQAESGANLDEYVEVNRSADMPLITPKMERTIAILDEAFHSGRKILIFTIFNRCGDLIREASSNLPLAYWGAINGSTAQEKRQEIVEDFSDYDGPACLILNPKAAGAGLNITAATVVVHFTQAWNPALEAQASARAHRRGQTQPVTIYRLFYEDTVERVMIDRSEWRRNLGNEALPISTRDSTDLRRALNLRPGADND